MMVKTIEEICMVDIPTPHKLFTICTSPPLCSQELLSLEFHF